MNSDERDFAASARKLTILQISIGGFVAAGFFIKGGAWLAQSAIYGALISVILTRLLSWGVGRAARAASKNKSKSVSMLYLGAAQRFLLALVLFGFGLAVIKLEPLPMIAGFCLAQAAYLIFIRMQQSSKSIV